LRRSEAVNFSIKLTANQHLFYLLRQQAAAYFDRWAAKSSWIVTSA
jgi:hypothetical protein